MDVLMLPGLELPAWAAPLERGQPVVLNDLPSSQYHGTRALVSKGGLDEANRSLAHYLHYLEGPHFEEEKSADIKEEFITGRAVHSLALEPMSFSREFVKLKDFGDMRSSTNRAMRDAWLREEHPGKTPLKPAQWQQIHAMRESLFKHKRIRRLLEAGRPEVTCAAICPITGLPRKCRWDWLSEIDGIGLDLKSARDGHPDRWKGEATRLRYHVQDTYYTDTGKLANVDVEILGFAVIEKTPPYVAGLYTMDVTTRLAGERAYMRDMQRIADACESGGWPGYGDDEACEIAFSKWAVSDTETLT